MKKIILLFMLLLLTGCKDYTEINDSWNNKWNDNRL